MTVADDILAIRMRLEGARQTRAELAAAAAEIRKMGGAAQTSGHDIDAANKKNFLYQQGLFTLRRAAYGLTLGLGTIGAGALAMGIRFDATMEQNRVSLTYFLGSTKAANRELSFLYQLAAKTPFEFGQVTDASRRFLAFGFTLKQTNDYLQVLGDTAAGLGLGGEDVARLAIILGQIKSSGRLLGQDTLQLAQAGINARGILQKQLNLSPGQMTALGQGTLTIPSDTAIPALMAGLRAQFRGSSALQANTGIGLWSTARDYARQFVGTLTGSLFERGKQNLKSVNSILQEMTHVLAPRSLGGQGGSFIDALPVLDRRTGQNGRIVEAWKELRAAGRDLFALLRAAAPVVVALWAAFGLGSPPMRIVLGLLGFIADHSRLVTIALTVLTIRFLFLKTVMGLWRITALLAGVDLVKFTGVTKEASAAERVFALNMYKSELGILAADRAGKRFAGTLRGLKGIGTITIGLALVDMLLPTAPRSADLGNPKYGSHGLISHVPVAGKLAGWGTWIGDKLADTVGLSKPKRDKVQQPSTNAEGETRVAEAVRKGVEQAFKNTDVKLDGRKVGELIARSAADAGARG